MSNHFYWICGNQWCGCSSVFRVGLNGSLQEKGETSA